MRDCEAVPSSKPWWAPPRSMGTSGMSSKPPGQPLSAHSIHNLLHILAQSPPCNSCSCLQRD